MQPGRSSTVDELHGQPPVAAALDRHHVGVVQPACEIEFALQPDGFGSAGVVVEYLQRDDPVCIGRNVRAVHGGEAAMPDDLVEHVALELVAPLQHAYSVGLRTANYP